MLRQWDLTPEKRLILNCCRPAFDETAASTVATLVREGIDWDQAMELAQREGVLPLFSNQLSTEVPELMPGDTLAELKRRNVEAAVRSLVSGRELLHVLEVIAEHGLRVLTFKGPALALTAHGSLASRMFSDVDLVVDEREFFACQEQLESHHYRVVADYGFEKAFRRKGSWITIDLHRRITPRAFPCRLRFEELWARRKIVTLLGADVPSLSVADNLLVLSLQVTRDRYENNASLAKFVDFAALMNRYPEIDWGALLEEAGRVGLARRLPVVLGAVAQLFDTPLPPSVSSLFDHSRVLGRLSHFTGKGVLGWSNSGLVGFLERVCFHCQVHESKRDKLAQFIMIPSRIQDTWRQRAASG